MKTNVMVVPALLRLATCQSNQTINAANFALPLLTPETSGQCMSIASRLNSHHTL